MIITLARYLRRGVLRLPNVGLLCPDYSNNCSITSEFLRDYQSISVSLLCEKGEILRNMYIAFLFRNSTALKIIIANCKLASLVL